MDNLKLQYRILKFIEKAIEVIEFPRETFVPETFGVTDVVFSRTLERLSNDGYITGIWFGSVLGQDVKTYKLNNPQITSKGLEYLAENSTMKKISEWAKGAVDALNANYKKIHFNST
jgi:DNA-binding PadR family transcriptional regulator